MRYSSLFATTLLLAGASIISGCDSGGTSSEPATIRLDVEPLVGTAAFRAGQTFTVAGRAGRLDVARFYLSGITLLNADGREISVSADAPVTVRARDAADAEVQQTIAERYVLVDAAAGHTLAPLGEMPAGSYTGIRFVLGVDGLDNRAAMEDFPAGHPLGAQEPSMHWSWNSGYVFLRLDGLLDINGDGTLDPETTPGAADSGQWRLHVGTAPNTVTVTLAQPFELAGGAVQDLHLQVDIARLVQGTDYAAPANRFCMTGGCQAVVDVAKANVPAAFSFHGVHHDD